MTWSLLRLRAAFAYMSADRVSITNHCQMADRPRGRVRVLTVSSLSQWRGRSRLFGDSALVRERSSPCVQNTNCARRLRHSSALCGSSPQERLCSEPAGLFMAPQGNFRAQGAKFHPLGAVTDRSGIGLEAGRRWSSPVPTPGLVKD